jgi:hypothetical protein
MSTDAYKQTTMTDNQIDYFSLVRIKYIKIDWFEKKLT